MAYSPAQCVEMKCKSSTKASALMKIMFADINPPVVFQISVPMLWAHSQKNHMHTVLKLGVGNNGAVGIFKIK